MAVTAALPALYPFAVGQRIAAAALKCAFFRNGAAVYGGGQGYYLKGGTRLVRIRDYAVAGQRIEQGNVASGRIVWVIVRLGGHSHYLAGVAVHYYALRGFRFVYLQGFLQRLFKEGLHYAVGGKYYVAAVHGVQYFLRTIRYGMTSTVCLGYHAAVFAGKVFFELLL